MGVSAVTFTATSIGLFNADYPGTALAAIVIGGGSTAGLYAVGLPSLWTTVSRATRRAAPMAAEILARLERLQPVHAALARPRQAGRRIGLDGKPKADSRTGD